MYIDLYLSLMGFRGVTYNETIPYFNDIIIIILGEIQPQQEVSYLA